MSNKFILCIPNSCGFNDTLCQINEAYMFSKKTNRKLIIDTRLSSLADHLTNYMELNDPATNIDLNLNDKNIQYLNKLNCFPKQFTGKINNIYPVFKIYNKYETFAYHFINNKNKQFKHNFLDRIMYFIYRVISLVIRRTIAKNFKYLYKNTKLELLVNKKEDLIIFHSYGGGESSIEAIKLFKLKDNICALIYKKINTLGIDYDAIHIRNTDISTNYLDFLKSIKNKLMQRTVLICTDDFFVVETAKQILSESNIISFNKPYNLVSNNKKISNTIHHQWNFPKDQIFENNINTFIDLIGMSKSKNFYYTNVNNSTVLVSGFSKLAENLKNNKQIANNWLAYG